MGTSRRTANRLVYTVHIYMCVYLNASTVCAYPRTIARFVMSCCDHDFNCISYLSHLISHLLFLSYISCLMQYHYSIIVYPLTHVSCLWYHDTSSHLLYSWCFRPSGRSPVQPRRPAPTAHGPRDVSNLTSVGDTMSSQRVSWIGPSTSTSNLRAWWWRWWWWCWCWW